MQQPDYLGRLVEIVSRSNQLNQLELVGISDCGMDGTMIEPIISALNTDIHTIKKIYFTHTNWNSDEAIEALLRLIATAPKLEYCSIGG